MRFLAVLYLYLPAFISNAMPVIASRIPGLRLWRVPVSIPVLGKNKTWRGVVSGIAGGIVCALAQWYFANVLPFEVPLHDRGIGMMLLFGLLLGAGAPAGDLAKSFLKRRLGLPPGSALPVIDGIDYIVGALLFLSPFYVPTLPDMALLLVIGAATASVMPGACARGLDPWPCDHQRDPSSRGWDATPAK